MIIAMNGAASAQNEVLGILRRDLMASQAKNASYSVRSFARKLKVSSAALSEILRGRRVITKRTAERFLTALCVHPKEAARLTSQLSNRNTVRKEKRNRYVKRNVDEAAYAELAAEQFDVISCWHHFAILSLAETVGFKSDPIWIARRLGISQSQATKAIETLLRLGLMVRGAGGKLKLTGAQFTTTTDISDLSIRKSHFENLDVQRQSLENDAVESRDFSSVIFTFDPSQMATAKKLIQDFRRYFSDTMEQSPKRDVYRLSIQLMPMTKDIQ